MIELNKIYNENNKITLDKMENNFIDLTVTSPPYNVSLGKNKYNTNPYDVYNDNKEFKDYISDLKIVFNKI